MTDDKMVWIDIETTGLDPDNDVILEVGLAVTDKWGTICDAEKWLVGELDQTRIVQISQADLVVGPMHTMSGLYDDWFAKLADDAGDMQIAYVEEQILDWLDLSIPEINPGTLPMCGASIGSLDRPFLKFWMPKLHDWFHYRSIDISSIRAVADMLNPEIGRAPQPDGGAKHRVLEDIAHSLTEYRHYTDNFFFVTERQAVVHADS